MRSSLLVILTLLVHVAAGQGLEAGVFVSYVPTISFRADGSSTSEYARDNVFAGFAFTVKLSRSVVVGLQVSRGISTLSEYVSEDGVQYIHHSLVSWLTEVPFQYQFQTSGPLTLRTGASVGWVQVIDRNSYRLRVRNSGGVSIRDFKLSVPKAGLTAGPHVEVGVVLTSSLKVRWCTAFRYARVRIPEVEGIFETDGNGIRVIREHRFGRTIRLDGVHTTVGFLYSLR